MEPIPWYQKDLIINGKKITHHGVFRADELLAEINRALEARGYQKREKKTEETVTESGVSTHVELRPVKYKSSYFTLMIKVKVTLSNITEAIEEVQGYKRNYQKGDVEVLFDAWALTDYEYRWGMRPFIFFLKGFINKYIYIWPMEADARDEVVTDTVYLFSRVKKLLRSYEHQPEKLISEEEVMRGMEEEIKKESFSEENKKNLGSAIP